jgi:hypothetical protein
MNRLHALASIGIFLFLCPAIVMGQTHDDLLKHRVRIYAVGDDGPLIGVVEIVSEDSLQLRDRYGRGYVVPLIEIERLQVSHGRWYVLSGLGGAAAGFAVGAMLSGVLSYDNELDRGLGGAAISLTTLILGAAVGVSLAPEKWFMYSLSSSPPVSATGSGLVIKVDLFY